MGLGDIVLSIFGGGATGIIGAAISRFADFKTKQLDYSQALQIGEIEIQKRSLDAKIIEHEWNARESIAATESETSIELADARSFDTALTSEAKIFSNTPKLTRSQNWLMVVLDFIRGFIRPGLTLYLCAITTAVYLQAGNIIKAQPISVEQAVSMYTQISSTILYLTTTAVLFYFGCRVRERN